MRKHVNKIKIYNDHFFFFLYVYGAQSIASRDSFWSHEYVVLVHVRLPVVYFIRSVSATMTMPI
jgi:hypothetical protein